MADPSKRRRTQYQITTFVSRASFGEYWYAPWPDSARRKLSLPTHQQQFLAWPLTTPETITVDKWFSPFNEPKRDKKGLPSSEQSFLAWGYTTPETITIDKWFEPWVEVPRPKVSIRVGSQQFFSTDTDPIVSFDWYANLRDPVRPKLALRFGIHQFFAPDLDPIVSFSWFGELSPPRAKQWLRIADQQSVIFVEAAPPAEEIPTLDIPGITITRRVTAVAY